MSTTLNHTELLTHVLTIGRQMVEIRSLLPLLRYVLDEVLTLIDGERGYIFLKNEDGGLSCHLGRDSGGHDLIDDRQTFSTTILNEVIEDQKTVRVWNAMQDDRFKTSSSVQKLRLLSVICTPLITQNKTIGAIYVENRSVSGRFRPDDVPPIEILANQAAISIENAQLNDQLQQVNHHLEELNELKNNFIMLISHELRTPLTSVTIYADLLRTSLLQYHKQQAYEISGRLEESVQTLDKLIQEIIYVFRIMSGKLDLQKEKTLLAPLLDPILTRFAKTIAERSLTIHLDGIDDLPYIHVDEEHFPLVLQNVLSNAIKYTPNGKNIWIKGHVHDSPANTPHLLITIRDEGIGIPASEQARVFDLFHGLGSLLNHSTSKANFQGGGLGLGLPIAKGVVEAHQGSIWLSSPGHDTNQLLGTTCHIAIPLNHAL